MKVQNAVLMTILAASLSVVVLHKAAAEDQPEDSTAANAQDMLTKGRKIFRFDTFGDETYWGGTLKLHEAIAGISPTTALAVGLKVDVDALPEEVTSGLKQGRVNVNDPAVTVALLKMNAVVGVTGFFNDKGGLRSIGIQCSFCHSTVDNSFAPGIGHRLDGWANRDLNVGAIVALAPNLQPVAGLLEVDVPTVRKILNSWGPGKFDAELFLDGKAFRPDGRSAATLIPPAFGLAGFNLHTWTGWGSVTQWNAFVANLEMHGQGTYFDPRLNDAKQFPVAAKAGFGNVRNNPDMITSKLAALQFYQLAIPAPKSPESGNPFNMAARRGEAVFNGKAQCARCHVPPLFTEPGFNMHAGAEIGIDDFEADRSPSHLYRTAPLRGLFSHQKGGFYHDGRFPTLRAVVDHYDQALATALTEDQKNDLVAYLKTL